MLKSSKIFGPWGFHIFFPWFSEAPPWPRARRSSKALGRHPGTPSGHANNVCEKNVEKMGDNIPRCSMVLEYLPKKTGHIFWVNDGKCRYKYSSTMEHLGMWIPWILCPVDGITLVNMEVSINGDSSTPKWIVYRTSRWNGWFKGIPIYGNTWKKTPDSFVDSVENGKSDSCCFMFFFPHRCFTRLPEFTPRAKCGEEVLKCHRISQQAKWQLNRTKIGMKLQQKWECLSDSLIIIKV